jgi:hypothetical protein
LTVQVAVSGGAAISSVPFHLLFDPAILEYLGAKEGTAFRGSSLQPIMLASVNPNRPGDLAVGLSLVASSGTLHGAGSVVTLEFRAVSPGKTALALDRAALHGPTGEELHAAFLSSAVTVR